jgi:hypothetical protein
LAASPGPDTQTSNALL